MKVDIKQTQHGNANHIIQFYCHLLSFTGVQLIGVVPQETVNRERNFINYIKVGTQGQGISKQDPETNIWAQEGCEWGIEKVQQ